MKKRISPMLVALQRVINESGWAADPMASLPISVQLAWQKAKLDGFIRQLTPFELGQLLLHKRSTRTIVLAMLNTAANDESRSSTWSLGTSVQECCDALDDIVRDIEYLNGNDKPVKRIPPNYYTLTTEGVAALERYAAA